jgi:hypothetical protein
MVAYDALQEIRADGSNAAARAVFDAHWTDLGYGLLLKRYREDVGNATDQEIVMAAQDTVPGVWPDHEVPHDHWRFTRYGLDAAVRAAGLERVELVPLGGLWSTLGQMACLELDRSLAGRALIPIVNLAARALDPTAREQLVMNWLVRARRPR